MTLRPTDGSLGDALRRFTPRAPAMRQAMGRLAVRYLAALRTHLVADPARDGASARSLGRVALADGLATLDLAIIHQEAMAALAPTHDFSGPRNSSIRRAGHFFTQALIPIEEALRTAREHGEAIAARHAMLRRHAAALAKGNRQLKHEIRRRQAGEAAILKAKVQYHRLYRESQLTQAKLRQLTHQVIKAQEDERKAISRELHDSVLQTLVGIDVELSALTKGASVGLRALKAKVARTQRLVKRSVNAVHRFARDLRPAALDDLGLIPALHSYSKTLAERKHFKIRLTAFAGVEALGNTRRTVLFRVAQEALTNVARHAEATEVAMRISQISGAVRMEISDNGKSFLVGRSLTTASPKRLGLIGMRERVEMVGGKLSIESKPGKGTTVRADIPFKVRKAAR
jgi:signal transduction histidine kinase